MLQDISLILFILHFMAIRSFRNEEQDTYVTLPNLISLARGVGGLVLGRMYAKGTIRPAVGCAAAIALGVSDGEGSLINATKRFPTMQRVLRIVPSTFGRKADPVMDKLFTGSVLAGATVSGDLPLLQTIGILATEVASSVATAYVVKSGVVPEVSILGKAAMSARCMSIGANLTASAVGGHETSCEGLLNIGRVTAVAATALGVASCYKLVQDYCLPTG